MKVKVIQDGERVIITFTGIEDPEKFLQNAVKIVSGCSEEEVVPQQALGLVPAVEEPEESYEENEDFEAPFTGMTPEEILAAPRFEGFYFLCRTEIPSRYKDECDNLLLEIAERNKIFSPPYGNIDRMKKYLKMAQGILGEDVLPNTSLTDEEEVLDVTCEYAAEKIFEFFNPKKS